MNISEPQFVCKGSLALGSGCGQCQRCCNELANVIAKLRADNKEGMPKALATDADADYMNSTYDFSPEWRVWAELQQWRKWGAA